MLFNSFEFLFAFLPIAACGYYALSRPAYWSRAVAWLVVCSLFFYGWWNPRYLALIGLSIVVNYLLGRRLARLARARPRRGRGLLALGIGLNLASIAYFKYAGFLVANAAALTGANWNLQHIVLPLAISFFTFQQITYLVDAWNGETAEYDFVTYCLFVTFFPQLIAGPIVHHAEMMPQFARRRRPREYADDISVGLFIFALGLTKKTVLADGVAGYASPVFADAESGVTLDMVAAWGGALAYTLQLYFDFSGYSDMAVGAARLFGVRLPINFNSPYKARNIIDFWRRWHMTLSRFLRDYLYIPLGGSRRGPTRRHVNLMVTMVLGGLWHGAGWTFVAWGGLHGCYLVINYVWTHIRLRLLPAPPAWLNGLASPIGHALTLFAVVVGWVFFRADSFTGAIAMLEGMTGLNGISLPAAVAFRAQGLADWLGHLGVDFHAGGGRQFLETWLWLAGLSLLVLATPNSQQLAGIDSHGDAPAGDASPASALPWRRRSLWAVVTGLLLATGTLALSQVSEFLYFQF